MLKRNRGGQPGNRNAWKHGRYSKFRRAERRAAREAEQRRSLEWAATIPATDYDAICDRLKLLRKS